MESLHIRGEKDLGLQKVLERRNLIEISYTKMKTINI